MEMPVWIDRLGGLIANTAGFWVGLGNLESSAHRSELDDIRIDRPIYVAGLARSGSTILLELLSSHPDCATHRYRDYPPIYTPLFWNRAFAQIYKSDTPAVERAHKDRILVTPDSPEAMEEVLWMRFFANRHDADTSQVLDAATSNPAFEKFYTDHIRKILLVRNGRRYLAKGNYNISRLAYLQKLFPDARFLVPVREPRGHVASLLKQHRLFCQQETEDARVLRHMQRVGHYEFGLDRRTLNLGDPVRARSVVELWKAGDDVRGLARHWATVYGFVLDQLERDPALAGHVRIVRYEDACSRPLETLRAAAQHAELEFPEAVLSEMAGKLEAPAYYKADFTAAQEAAIAEETGAVAMRLGYGAAT